MFLIGFFLGSLTSGVFLSLGFFFARFLSQSSIPIVQRPAQQQNRSPLFHPVQKRKPKFISEEEEYKREINTPRGESDP